MKTFQGQTLTSYCIFTKTPSHTWPSQKKKEAKVTMLMAQYVLSRRLRYLRICRLPSPPIASCLVWIIHHSTFSHTTPEHEQKEENDSLIVTRPHEFSNLPSNIPSDQQTRLFCSSCESLKTLKSPSSHSLSKKRKCTDPTPARHHSRHAYPVDFYVYVGDGSQGEDEPHCIWSQVTD